MADRSLRGTRIGGHSLQSEEGIVYSPRQNATYRLPDGTEFTMTFSADAEVPEVWPSPKSGIEGRLLDPDGSPIEIAVPEDVKAPRTHWDMLLERRSREELEVLLEERLTVLRTRRGQQKVGA